jgi:hypothetical protein
MVSADQPQSVRPLPAHAPSMGGCPGLRKAGTTAAWGDLQDEDRGHHEGQRVCGDDPRQPGRHEQDTAEGAPQQPRGVGAEGAEAVGGSQVGGGDDSRQEGRPRGFGDLRQARLDEGHDIDQREVVTVRDGQQRQHHHRLGEVGGQQGAPTVPAVHKYAGERPEQEAGDQFEHEHGRRDERRAGLLEHVDRQGDQQQPVAGVGGQPGGQQSRQRSVAQQSHSRVPRCSGTHPGCAPPAPGRDRGNARRLTCTGSASSGTSSRVKPM